MAGWPKSRWVSYFYIIAWNKCWFCTDITSYKSPMPREPVLNFSQQRETRKNQRLGGGRAEKKVWKKQKCHCHVPFDLSPLVARRMRWTSSSALANETFENNRNQKYTNNKYSSRGRKYQCRLRLGILQPKAKKVASKGPIDLKGKQAAQGKV